MKEIKIDWKEYNINSNNEALCKALPEISKWNPETMAYEKVAYKYLPVNMLYTLLNWLFDSWSFKLTSVQKNWTYTVEKNKKDAKWNMTRIADEMERLLVQYELSVQDWDRITTHSTFAETIMSKSIIVSDTSLNWSDAKVEARALKRLAKRLWNVFVVGGMDDEADEAEVMALNDSKNIIEPVTKKTETKETVKETKKEEVKETKEAKETKEVKKEVEQNKVDEPETVDFTLKIIDFFNQYTGEQLNDKTKIIAAWKKCKEEYGLSNESEEYQTLLWYVKELIAALK